MTEIARIIEAFLLPPGGPLLLIAVGLLFARRPVGRVLAAMGLVLLWAFSLPVVSHLLIDPLEIHPPLDGASARYADAIVVLGGGRYPAAPEYGGDTLSTSSLERVRYAAFLHHATGLPVIASGGAPFGESGSEALLMGQALRELGVMAVLTEDTSRNTWENAAYTEAVLQNRAWRRVLLVTHAWHMPRALQSFAATSVDTVAAPTAFTTSNRNAPPLLQWLPSANALATSRRALHEWLGMQWYRIRG